jgi:chromosome segregation ATPase
VTTLTLAAFRPRDDTVVSVQIALAAAAEERRAALRRLAELQSKRSRALLDPSVTTSQIATLETEARSTELLIERLAAIQPELETRLVAAREAAQLAEINRLSAMATGEIDAYRSALEQYPELAARIATICEQGRRAEAAVKNAQRAAEAIGGHLAFDMPEFCGSMLPDVIVLPSRSGMFWGQRPLPEPVFRY